MFIRFKLVLLYVAIAVGVVAVLLVLFAFYSIFLRRASERYRKTALKFLRENRITEALEWFLKAEAHWALNSHDGGRRSLTKDLNHYTSIADGVFRVVGIQSGHVRDDIHGIIAEMKAHLLDRSNFGADGRTMKSDAAIRWKAMCDRLESFRGAVREACQVKIGI